MTNTIAMTLAQKADRILAQTRGLSGATPNATQLIEELRWALEAYRQENARLTAERDEIQRELRRAETESSMLRVECGVIAKERDEARRLLKGVIDICKETTLPTDAVPSHDCSYKFRTDIGMCKMCADWTDALAMIYPDEFQEVAADLDSARWEVCELSGNGSIDSAMRVAKERGWNLTEEDSDAEESH